jgi:peptide/nickel transport system substrate-binding protein
MDRRTFLKTSAGAGALLAAFPAPAISQRADARTLRIVPHADLANFDPIVNSAYVVRNAGILVWDTLYGVDSGLQPQRQMVESEEVSADGLTWTFRLRPGLKFHDGEPVLAKDAVASINRWAAREPMGGMIKAVENELAAVDDRTFRWSLRKPVRKCCWRWARSARRAVSSCRLASPRPIRSSRSANTSAAGRCVS